MNPSKKGWLNDFVSHRIERYINDEKFNKTKMGQDPDQSFYGLIQPTGFMYGLPVSSMLGTEEAEWSDRDKVKVLLVDSLINVSELYNESPLDTEKRFSNHIQDTLDNINQFYEKVYPEISVSTKNWLGKKKDTYSLAEEVIEKRVSMTRSDKDNFWLAFFQHSQLFLDVYIFGQWSHTQPDQILLDFFRGEKEELSYNAVKVMAAAAHANSTIEEEEEQLFELFIESSGIPTEKKRVAQEYFIHGIGIQDIPVEQSDPWIIRKYFLELAVLTVWSDKRVEEEETQFLKSFNQSLGFSEDDFNKSMIAVEGFVLENWSKLDSLQNKKNYDQVSDEYIGRLAEIAEKYKTYVLGALKEDARVESLIKKGNTEELTPEEQETIRSKFLAILQSIPMFRVVAIPKGFLSYKNILRVIPKETIKAISG